MIEIKVQCDCGQRYSFDVEPVNGQMPFTVACPLCGLDGTAKANQLLREPRPVAAPRPPAAPPIPVAVPPSMPAQISPVSVSAPPPPPAMAAAAVAASPAPAAAPERPRLRISGGHSAAPVAEAPPPVAAPSPSARPARPPARPVGAPMLTMEQEKPVNMGLGALGALLGAAVGGLIYFAVMHYTGFELSAVVVGFMAGLGGWWLGRPGCNELGVVAATFAIVCIISALYINARNEWNEEVMGDLTYGYEEAVKEARELVKEVPNGTDDEIRMHLAKVYEYERPNQITAEEIQEFREEEYNAARDLASGKTTREQYEAENADWLKAMEGARELGENTFMAFFVIALLSKKTLAGFAVAAGLAWKMSS